VLGGKAQITGSDNRSHFADFYIRLGWYNDQHILGIAFENNRLSDAIGRAFSGIAHMGIANANAVQIV
jgi:hypothetical protein